MKKALSRARNLVKSYNDGTNGIETNGGSRLHMAAHSAGKLAYRHAVSEVRKLDHKKNAELSRVIEQSAGPNRAGLRLIDKIEMLPDSARSNSKPRWGYEYVDQDGTRTKNWVIILQAPGAKSPRPEASVTLTETLGNLHVYGSRIAGKDLVEPVHNMTAHVSSAQLESGEYGPAKTTFCINSKAYDENDRLTDSPEPTGGIRLEYDEEGNLSALGLTVGNQAGYRPEDTSGVAVSMLELLDRANMALEVTAQVYGELDSI